jgi:iron complex transport system ATP-binding protein
MNTICLETRDLTIGYHSRAAKTVASGLNLTLRNGQLTCLIGPNGSGKSTLLRTLAGLQKPLSGEITLNGENLRDLDAGELARLVSVVLTEHFPPGNLTVRQVVALGRLPYTDWLGALTGDDHAVVDAVLQQLEAGHLAQRSFFALSDGERQKAMIARALAQQPALMILDEPTAFLDWPNRVAVLMKLKELSRSTGKAFLLSSHDLELVCQATDELWVMECSGAITCGSPAELIESGLLDAVFSTPYGGFGSGHPAFR